MEMMLVRATYGDRAAGNYLAQSRDIVANDFRVTNFVKDFILNRIFVDDGLTSSQSKQKLRDAAAELPRAFSNYSFEIKHVILSFERPESSGAGVTLSQDLERCLGIVWDFASDEFTPALEVYLSKKVRGLHTDHQLSEEMIDSCVPTRRILLRLVGCLHDISGRHLGPLQIKSRIIYSRTCALNKDIPWDSPIENQVIIDTIKTLMWDIVKVKQTFVPQPRAWVPEGFVMDFGIGPYDGSIEAFGANFYVRSVNSDTVIQVS